MSTTSSDGTTHLLVQWQNGQPRALDRLIEGVYTELRQIGQRQLRGERRGHTLQTTALIHEAYVRLVELRHIDWRDRRHFFAVAAGIMRRVLVDHARSHHALKRGGAALRVTLDDNLPAPRDAVDVVDLDRALSRLAERNPVQAQVVELRYFGGLTVAETATVLGIASATVKRKWTLAQAWLYRELHNV